MSKLGINSLVVSPIIAMDTRFGVLVVGALKDDEALGIDDKNLIDAVLGGNSEKARPVGTITFALNYYFHQYSPEGYHLVNIIIHIWFVFQTKKS